MLRRRKTTWTAPAGEVYNLYLDMLNQPHLLIAGATGSGKSVVINAMMYTAMSYHPVGNKPTGKQFILIDPKRVELVAYRDLPHTIRYASEPGEIVSAISYALEICEQRYRAMQKAGVRRYPGGDIYLVIDEFADLMTTNRLVIMPLVQRLAQIGRAAKIHIILATQTPIAKVLPTEIKCNFDARLALRTRSAQDSRNIIGKTGCEDLPRYGQGYYMTPDAEGLWTIPMYSDEQLERRIDFWNRQR